MTFSAAKFAGRCSTVTVIAVTTGLTLAGVVGQISSVPAQDVSNILQDVSAVRWQRIEISIPMNDQNMKAAGITTTQIEPDQGKADLTFPGTVSIPQHQLRIVSAPGGGLVETMLVSPDEQVTEGQAIAQIRSPDLVEAQRNYLAAVAEEALGADRLHRARVLVEGKALPERELRVAETAAATASARLDERRQILFLMGMDKEEFETLQANKIILDKIVVHSPVSGTVISRHAGTGEQIRSAAPLYIVGVLDPLWVNIQIPAHRLATISVGSGVSLSAYGLEGRIVRIGRTVDQATQSVIAVAEINNTGGRLRPGLALTATVHLKPADAALAGRNWSVPSTSVVRHRDQSWVFMRSADGFRARPVQVVNESAKTVAIRADFRAHDEVASRGVLALLSELVDADKED